MSFNVSVRCVVQFNFYRVSLLAQRRCSSPSAPPWEKEVRLGERRFGVYPRSGALCADGNRLTPP